MTLPVTWEWIRVDLPHSTWHRAGHSSVILPRCNYAALAGDGHGASAGVGEGGAALDGSGPALVVFGGINEDEDRVNDVGVMPLPDCIV